MKLERSREFDVRIRYLPRPVRGGLTIVGAFADGTKDQIVEDINDLLAGTAAVFRALINYDETLQKAEEIAEWVKNNPDEARRAGIDAATQTKEQIVHALDQFFQRVGRNVTILAIARVTGDEKAIEDASYVLGQDIGPLLLSAGTGALAKAVLRGGSSLVIGIATRIDNFIETRRANQTRRDTDNDQTDGSNNDGATDESDTDRDESDDAPDGGNVCSFHGDTLVLTDGGMTPIRDVNTSMSVWSRNPATGAMAMKPVEAQYSNPYDETISVSIREVGNDDAQAGAVQTIVSNRIHPYFVQTTRQATNSEGHDYQGPIANGKWVDAGDLLAGDRLLNNDATWSQVVSVTAEDKPLTAYNLTVTGFHTYFVSGSNASNLDAAFVWVHNDCFPDAQEMARRLGVTKDVFHREIKPAIVDDFKHGLQRKGVRNPDIGTDVAGNIIFRDPVSKRVVLRTDVPLSSYGQ